MQLQTCRRDFVRVLTGRCGFNCGSMLREAGWLLTAVTAPGICLRTQHCWTSFAEKSIQSSVSHDTLGNDLGMRTVVVADRVLKTMLGSLAQGCCDGGMGRRQGNICSINVGRRVGVLGLLNRQQQPLTVNLPVKSDLRVKGVGGAFVYSNWWAIMHCWCWTTKSRYSSPAGLFSTAKSFCINQTSHPCSTDRTGSPPKRGRARLGFSGF